ncbi:hypothetical protein [Nocardia thailandica]|uniref:hypothetical protein n=1 Tax=Nocardia thailandica TaxID=257275 RepID=UPI00030A1BAB|nr:hypothetical protein [Nocardia thailandica]
MTVSIRLFVEPDETIDRWNDVETLGHLEELDARVRPVVEPFGGRTSVVHQPAGKPWASPPDANVVVELDDLATIAQALKTGARVAAALADAGHAVSSVDVQDWQYVVALA